MSSTSGNGADGKGTTADVAMSPSALDNAASSASSQKRPLLSHSGSSIGSLPERMEKVEVMEVDDAGGDVVDNQPQKSQKSEENSFPAAPPSQRITLIAKYGKERITLDDLSKQTTIGEVKSMLQAETRILPKRQKLVGLVAAKGGAKAVTEELVLGELKKPKPTAQLKSAGGGGGGDDAITYQFILMGTPEEEIFVDPSERDQNDLPDVIDDFDLDFNAGSNEWCQHVVNEKKLKKFTEQTEVCIMNPPRDGKKLLVLDLDHTLLDFSSKTLLNNNGNGPASSAAASAAGLAEMMKRPHMDDFLTACYHHYDLVVWSQTSWRWLETKLIELGMLTNPGYKFCFVLDKTSMFTITSTRRGNGGKSITHHVKPLQLIWSKFSDRWNSHNTVHIDDLSRNFALNMSSGLKVKAYYRKKSSSRRDVELLGLGRYLQQVALAGVNFDQVNFDQWEDVVNGRRPLVSDEAGGTASSDKNDEQKDGST